MNKAFLILSSLASVVWLFNWWLDYCVVQRRRQIDAILTTLENRQLENVRWVSDSGVRVQILEVQPYSVKFRVLIGGDVYTRSRRGFAKWHRPLNPGE
jgi:hypothetical protein